ncbi:MAG: fumarylacetoacetate hydrolase family protein [Bradyrhizobium sp.]|nr:MAG: fumarylacetoacetate hydrolase family protein [Bradyrhizobium sp.]
MHSRFCRELQSYCRPGDVIVSGTPGGVGSRREPPLWMKPGDVVEIEVERLGVLRNVVEDEA